MSRKKKMQIELQQHRLQTRKTKFLRADAIFLQAFPHLHPFCTCDYNDEHNLEQLKKKQANVFLIFPFSEPTGSKAFSPFLADNRYLRETGWQVQYNVTNSQL